MSSRIIPVPPFDYVVFGATGDLTRRKLIPALYHRFADGQFDEKSRIIGVARSKWTEAKMREMARASVKELEAERRRVTLATVCTVGDKKVLDGEATLMLPRARDEG